MAPGTSWTLVRHIGAGAFQESPQLEGCSGAWQGPAESPTMTTCPRLRSSRVLRAGCLALLRPSFPAGAQPGNCPSSRAPLVPASQQPPEQTARGAQWVPGSSDKLRRPLPGPRACRWEAGWEVAPQAWQEGSRRGFTVGEGPLVSARWLVTRGPPTAPPRGSASVFPRSDSS